MNYRLRYRREAIDQLAAIWLAAVDRAAITRVSDRVNRTLQINPHGLGEARGGWDRVWVVRPLIVAFEIQDEDHRVVVNTIRLLRPRS